MANGYTAEICAAIGFDWLVVDGEHAPNDIRSMLQQLQAIAAYPVHPVVRLPIGETYLIKQVLDIGAQTVLVPMVETARYAEDLVVATRYPPGGVRGIASALARAACWNMTSDYLETANDQICLLVQIETRRGLDNLDVIAAVPGIDGVFIGPVDLAGNLGHLGKTGAREVISVIERGIRRIRLAGKAAGIFECDENLVRHYLSLGCTFVAVGADVIILSRAGQALARQFKNLLQAIPATDEGGCRG